MHNSGFPREAGFFLDNVHLGVGEIRMGGGLGMRFDNNPAAKNFANSTSNAARRSGFQLDPVYVEGASHGVELYGVEDNAIGRVVARNTSQAGLMLDNSRNVEVGRVDSQGVSPNAGYAVFRMANDNGKDGYTDTHPMSIHGRAAAVKPSRRTTCRQYGLPCGCAGILTTRAPGDSLD